MSVLTSSPLLLKLLALSSVSTEQLKTPLPTNNKHRVLDVLMEVASLAWDVVVEEAWECPVK